MVFGWRRAFCTSVDKDHTSTPRIRPNFGFLSNPSTPRLRSDSIAVPGLGCRSAAATAVATTSSSSLPSSPKLHCRTTSNATPKKNVSTSPRLFSSFSNPSSPKSPSSGLSLLRATLLLNKSSSSSRCGICLQSMKSDQDSAIFTAECSHAFHHHCVVSLGGKRCPVCATVWANDFGTDPKRRPESESKIREIKTGKSLRVYNDDEPLTYSPVSRAQFNTILESDENDVEDDDEFPGFFVNTTSSALSSKSVDPPISKSLEVRLEPESAVVAAGRRYETHAVVMKVKAPPLTGASGTRRTSVDLVTVLDLSGGVKLQTVKHAMRLMISLLGETDRLSIVVFSSGSKRLLPLRRMTAEGRRTARRIVDAFAGGSIAGAGAGMSVKDAVKKAVKVVEDRREKNPTASIVVLSDGQDNPAVLKAQLGSKRVPFVVSTTRFSHPEIPVHSVWVAPGVALDHAPLRDAFTERVAGLLNSAMKEVRLQLGLVSGSGSLEIASVYSLNGRPDRFGSGSVVVGDLFADEERELLVELKVPTSLRGSHHVMSVRSSVIDSSTQQQIIGPTEHRLLIPRPQTVRSSCPSIERLRSLHAASRAVAESRRLIEREDLAAAYQLLSTARATVSQNKAGSIDHSFRGLEAELAELNRLRHRTCSVAQTEEKARRSRQRNGSVAQVEEKAVEPLTPTSAWRAAEKLAKVAIMRKHMNRVSDLHGFEDARF